MGQGRSRVCSVITSRDTAFYRSLCFLFYLYWNPYSVFFSIVFFLRPNDWIFTSVIELLIFTNWCWKPGIKLLCRKATLWDTRVRTCSNVRGKPLAPRVQTSPILSKWLGCLLSYKFKRITLLLDRCQFCTLTQTTQSQTHMVAQLSGFPKHVFSQKEQERNSVSCIERQ